MPGRTISEAAGALHRRLSGTDRAESVDEIQRLLQAGIEADPRGPAAREALFENLPEDPDALSFWLSIAVGLSEPRTVVVRHGRWRMYGDACALGSGGIRGEPA